MKVGLCLHEQKLLSVVECEEKYVCRLLKMSLSCKWISQNVENIENLPGWMCISKCVGTTF